MKLISCDGCGVVLDAEVLDFAGVRTHNDHGEVIEGNAVYNGQEYEPVVSCPNCSDTINEAGEVQHFMYD